MIAARAASLALAVGTVALLPPRAAAFTLAQTASHYPPCTTGQLQGFPWVHPAFGHDVPGIALRNVTLQTCRAAGFAEVRAFETDGRPAPVHIERKLFADTRVYAYRVPPGGAVFFALYGQPPKGNFDRSCIAIGQYDVRLPTSTESTHVTVASGTCGGKLTESQLFPAAELAR